MKNNVLFLSQAAVIAAVYVALTVAGASFSFGAMQVRVAEALTVLPYFTPAAIPGLFAGCVVANLLGGGIPLDIVFGSLATLLGALGSYLVRKNRCLVPLPPILANVLIVPFVLSYGYGDPLPIPVLMLSIGIGECISCYLLGMVLLFALEKRKRHLFTA